MAIDPWVRLPSEWILNGGLKQLAWKREGVGSANTAALMALTAIAHRVERETGIARSTYDELCNATGLSRAKFSNGLSVLKDLGVLEPLGRSTYKLANYDPNTGWAKFPAKSMYAGGQIRAFEDLRLRSSTELDGLKLFFLFVARRDRTTNITNVSFDKIVDFTGILRPRIRRALSWLTVLSLIHVDRIPSQEDPKNWSNTYRIIGIDAYNHRGTTGRGIDHGTVETTRDLREAPF
jgi:hypothetical protein